MPIPRQDAHSTARCPFHGKITFHGKMPIPRQDAHSTARCPFHARCPFYRCDPRARGIARGLGGTHLPLKSFHY
ncbi:MAG: hypothetical protein F6J94_00530 [Moorea sp. SIO1F2]|uniref:hypothetical protein n=1 Tax=Moorena sp. SIO1F2 TaxID=2607819 RepID=UPI0013B727BD|nr:hypothetical protein [Moorena sp. SIO1F2]NET80529.1 hypothetical protein [Moorena sp. SIO1F2]